MHGVFWGRSPPEKPDIKVLEEVPTEGAEGEIDAEPEKEAEEETADGAGDSSDPVRLYLKEMGNFQLLSREQEVEIAKRIEAGEQEVEEEVLKSPVTLDFLSTWATGSRPARPTCATSSRKAKNPPISTRSAGPKPTRSC